MSATTAGKCVNRKPFLLLVEEDVQIRELLELWLGEAGYHVSTTREAPPRLVIIDLPRSAGAQALILSLRAVYAAPILVLSGRFRRGLAESADAARRLGVKKVLPIPFTREELLAAVAASLVDEH
jgi:DNA-binding response OmpR family regulator